MSGPHAVLTASVMANIAGTQAAQKLVHAIRLGHAKPDALLEALNAELDRGDAERLRGFVRTVQKCLESAQ